MYFHQINEISAAGPGPCCGGGQWSLGRQCSGWVATATAGLSIYCVDTTDAGAGAGSTLYPVMILHRLPSFVGTMLSCLFIECIISKL